jgi:general secretion pathway protein K
MMARPAPSSAISQSGVALILVLWVLVLLTVIAGSFAYSVHSNTLMAANAVDSAKAQAFADGGVFRGIFELLGPQNAQQDWKPDGQTHITRIDGQEVAVTLTDEAGKIDLNGAPPALLQSLLQSVGVSAEHAGDLAQTIVAWRSPPPSGAGLQAPLGTPPAHGPFRSIEALLQVPGMTPGLFRRISPLVTVYTGLPGVNTLIASAPVLSAIPGVSPQLAQAYVQQRQALQQAGQPVPALTQAGAYNVASLSGVIGVRSEVQLANGVGFTREAVVRITNQPGQPFQILSWQEVFPSAPMTLSSAGA